MSKNIVWGFIILASACSGNSPTTPSRVTSKPSSSSELNVESNQWPVGDGRYGWENPNYPPPSCACPFGYSNHYNGWNFVCETSSGLRTMPHLSSCSK